MELREYWAIITRRWWIIAVLGLIALALSVLLAPQTENRYVATVRLAISIIPEPQSPGIYNFDRFYAFQASEFLVDDFAGLVRSQAFATDVSRILNDPSISVGEIQGSRSTEKSHRLLTITTTTNNADKSKRIADATVVALEQRGPAYFRQLSSDEGFVTVIDPATVQVISGQQRQILDIAVRTALGLIAGLALVLLLHYLDRAIYSPREVEQLLGLPVIGELPPDRLTR